MSIHNPYLTAASAARFGEPDPEVVRSLADAGDRAGIQAYIEELQRMRDAFAVRFAHAIPHEDALAALATLSPLIEIGAGTGYWAWLLRLRGCDVVAFDACPPTTLSHANLFHRNLNTVGVCWTEVRPGGSEQVASYPKHSLFLCWPPADDTAEQALAAHQGQHLAFIGTHQPHIPIATPTFHAALRSQFALRTIVDLPHWYGVEDRLTIWTRR